MQTTISNLMTKNPIVVKPNTILTEVDEIFVNNTFHHLPVVNDEGKCVGVISRTDYHQLQCHYTKLGTSNFERSNKRFFASLIAKEIMSENPVTVESKAELNEVLDLILENEYHSVIVQDNDVCVGIITSHDLLQYLRNLKLVAI